MKIIKYGFYILSFILALAFAILNASSVTVNLFFIHIQLPMSVMIVLIFILGFIFGYLTNTLVRFRRQ